MKSSKPLAWGALLCALAGSAGAQSDPDRKFYLGVDLGQSELNRELAAFSAGPGSEHQATAWKLRFGYRLSQYFSLEVAHTDFGDFDGSLPLAIPGTTTFVATDHTTSAKGFDLSLNGTWPIGKVFYLNASAGLMRREFQTDLKILFAGQSRLTDGDLASQFGLGFGFTLNQALDIGVNWVTTSNLEGDMEFPENAADPTMLSLGLRFRM